MCAPPAITSPSLRLFRQDLVLNQQTDYVCLDDIIVDLKLTPDALEMRVPRYFRDDRDAEIKKREELMVTASDSEKIASAVVDAPAASHFAAVRTHC